MSIPCEKFFVIRYFYNGKRYDIILLHEKTFRITGESRKEVDVMGEMHLPHDHGQAIEKSFEHMPNTEDFQTVSDIFKQLGDGSRIKIFWILCHCEECVINLSSMVEMSSPAVSHHLGQLKAAGLIVSRRDGKEVYYRAADNQEAELLHHMIEKLVEISCPSM